MKALSLFSGCGGMDLGFKKEGFDMVWAIDSDKDACETYRKNIGEHIVNQDIVKINFNDVPNCDIILGGFPCQDFSVIWKQPGLNGRRGDLYRHFIRAVVAKKPKAFVAENVRGLLSANGGKAYEKIIRDFTSIGYTLYPNVYNFADYGVPQVRHRLIIVGINNKINNQFTIPLATHGKNAKLQHVSVRKALQHINNVKPNSERINIADKTRKMLDIIPPGGNFSNIPKTSPYRIKGMISHVYRRLAPDRPAYTIIASGGGGTWGYHHKESRPLTNRERARLQTFPDTFIFQGKVASVRRQIGNAVPPEGVRPIARSLMKMLSIRTNKIERKPHNRLPLQNKIKNGADKWLRHEHNIDVKRKALLKISNHIPKIGIEKWRGIETYDTKEFTNILSTLNKKEMDHMIKILKMHRDFYNAYYGKNSIVSARMDQCEYNLRNAIDVVKNTCVIKI